MVEMAKVVVHGEGSGVDGKGGGRDGVGGGRNGECSGRDRGSDASRGPRSVPRTGCYKERGMGPEDTR